METKIVYRRVPGRQRETNRCTVGKTDESSVEIKIEGMVERQNSKIEEEVQNKMYVYMCQTETGIGRP